MSAQFSSSSKRPPFSPSKRTLTSHQQPQSIVYTEAALGTSIANVQVGCYFIAETHDTRCTDSVGPHLRWRRAPAVVPFCNPSRQFPKCDAAAPHKGFRPSSTLLTRTGASSHLCACPNALPTPAPWRCPCNFGQKLQQTKGQSWTGSDTFPTNTRLGSGRHVQAGENRAS